MMWLFLILVCSGGAVLSAGIAAYVRVHRHMRSSAALKKTGIEREADSP
jgi:hypothetical protein